MHAPIWISPLSDEPAAHAPRIDRVVFELELPAFDTPPTTAEFHLLARMRYVLRLNDTELGTGPIRSYPEHHEYDSYDLAPHLSSGPNRLSVEVLHWNMATFHNLQEAPGFEAWGSILLPSSAPFSLATPGAWRCRRLATLDPTAPRLSFAQPPVEIVDFSADASPWSDPIAAAPDPTAHPAPRSIPPLTRIPLAPASILCAPILPSAELVIGARLTDDGDGSNPFPPTERYGALAAAIFSPTDQVVTASGWWGEYTLNGAPIAPQPDPSRPFSQLLSLPLKAGWNRLFVSQRLAFGYAEFCIALPLSANLRIHTAPSDAAPNGFLFTPQPLSPSDLASPDSLPWEIRPIPTLHPSPLRHVAWARPDASAIRALPIHAPISLPAGQTTLLSIDMGQLVLGRLSLDISAPRGTLLDFTHAEECQQDSATSTAPRLPRARVDKTVVVYGADRWILASGRATHTHLSPRGFRYLDLLISVPANAPDATLHALSVLEERYPYTQPPANTLAPEFHDPDFSRLWDYGRRTLELCSNDVFVDCPWRERTLYGGDLLPELAASILFSPHDLRLARHSIDVVLQSLGSSGWLASQAPYPRPEGEQSLGEYPLLTSIATGWYLHLSHDIAFAQHAWPTFHILAETASAWLRPDGIYAVPGRSFIDHGHRLSHGPTCEFNSALVAAFRAWALTADMASDPLAAASLRAKADALDAAIPRAFFDPTAGTYRDLPLAKGGSETEGTPANIWPLLYTRSARDVAPQALQAIRKALEQFDPNDEHNSVSPYQMFTLLAALHAYGEQALAEKAIRIVYQPMLSHPTGTLWEHARTDQSLVHAWSCGALSFLAATSLHRTDCFPPLP